MGILITVGVFLLCILIHWMLGGDKGQANRSEWYPLLYIVPAMMGLLAFFILNDKSQNKK